MGGYQFFGYQIDFQLLFHYLIQLTFIEESSNAQKQAAIDKIIWFFLPSYVEGSKPLLEINYADVGKIGIGILLILFFLLLYFGYLDGLQLLREGVKLKNLISKQSNIFKPTSIYTFTMDAKAALRHVLTKLVELNQPAPYDSIIVKVKSTSAALEPLAIDILHEVDLFQIDKSRVILTPDIV